MEGCWGLDLQAAGGSPVFHAVGFVILVPKFSTLGLNLFDVLSLANTWQAFRFNVFLFLDTLISISCSLRATGSRLRGYVFTVSASSLINTW